MIIVIITAMNLAFAIYLFSHRIYLQKKKIIKDSIQIYKEIYIIFSNSPFYVSATLHSTAFDTDSYERTLIQYNQNSNQQRIFCE